MQALQWQQAECIIGEPAERDRLLEIELEENIRRLNMSWQERCLAVAKIHKLKREKDPYSKWGVRETGELLGQHFTHVAKLIKVAQCLSRTGDKRDEEMWQAINLDAAIALLLKRKESKVAAQLAAQEKATREATALRLGITNGLAPSTVDEIDQLIADHTPEGVGLATINITHFYHCADFRTHLPALAPDSFDHVVTDIPYGVDMKNLDKFVDLDTVADQHDVEDNLQLMPIFLSETYRVLRPGGYCVFWYDMIHHEHLRKLAKKAGYRVQEWPLIWCKTHPCVNNAASQNWTKATECAMVCRKGNAVLVGQQPCNYIMASSAEDRARYNNPFAKPRAVWDFIYRAIARPGQVILDPYAGESSSALAAIPLGLQPYQIELVQHHHDRAIQHVTEYYRTLHKGRVQFV
jgi:tRNA G10  N-methylase Trm11